MGSEETIAAQPIHHQHFYLFQLGIQTLQTDREFLFPQCGLHIKVSRKHNEHKKTR